MKAEGREGQDNNMKAEGREGQDNNMKAEGREGRDNNMKAESREGRDNGKMNAETKTGGERSQTRPARPAPARSSRPSSAPRSRR